MITCSLYCNLSATKILEGLELWGQRYCYWQRRRPWPWFDGHGWRWCVVLCVVRGCACCGGGAYPPFANVLGVDFSIIFHPKNTSFAHTKIPSKKPFCATHIPHFGTNLPHQNKEYVRCDSRSMWHLVHFERRGIRGKHSISMEFQNFHSCLQPHRSRVNWESLPTWAVSEHRPPFLESPAKKYLPRVE